MKLSNKQKRIVAAIQQSAGRFFGLETVNGNVYNAQLRKETPAYVTVYDRNYDKEYRLSKANLAHFRLADTQI